MNDKWYGFRAAHRNRWEFIGERILKEQEFILYEYLIDMADWDSKHKKFGLVEYMPDEISMVFHKTRETINARFKRLLALGFVRIHDVKRSLYKITKFDRYIPFSAKKYAANERGLPIRRIIAEWDLFRDKNKKNLGEIEKIRQSKTNLIKNISSKVYVSFKDKSKIWNDTGELDHKFLANLFFDGDIEQYSLHLLRGNV